MKHCPSFRKFAPSLALAALFAAPAAHSATSFIAINSFNPSTHFSVTGFVGGLDFNDDSNTGVAGNQYFTQAGFTSVPHSTTQKVYTNLAAGGGIQVDINVSNANLNNENRYRGTNGGANSGLFGDLIVDFEQWHGSTAGSPVEAAFTFKNLIANTDYEISFFHYNAGAGQMTHSFYDGSSSASALIVTDTTAGTNTNYATWSPGITIAFNSGASTTKALAMQATQGASPGFDSRLTFNGLSIVQGATVPEPSSLALLGLGGLALFRRRR